MLACMGFDKAAYTRLSTMVWAAVIGVACFANAQGGNVAESGQEEHVERRVVLKCPAPETPEKVMVYKMIGHETTEESALDIAQKHFGFSATVKPGYRDYIQVVGDGQRVMVWKRDEKWFFWEKDGFGKDLVQRVALKREDLPPDEQCVAIAEAFLESRGLLPPKDEYVRCSTVADNRSSKSAMTVGFRRRIGVLRSAYWGSIDVDVGPHGEVGDVRYRWAHLEPVGEYPLITVEDAVERFRAGEGFIYDFSVLHGDITEVELVYYPCGGYMRPCYSFIGASEHGELRGYVDALDDTAVVDDPALAEALAAGLQVFDR